jgi:hypothetical protein
VLVNSRLKKKYSLSEVDYRRRGHEDAVSISTSGRVYQPHPLNAMATGCHLFVVFPG